MFEEINSFEASGQTLLDNSALKSVNLLMKNGNTACHYHNISFKQLVC